MITILYYSPTVLSTTTQLRATIIIGLLLVLTLLLLPLLSSLNIDIIELIRLTNRNMK